MYSKVDVLWSKTHASLFSVFVSLEPTHSDESAFETFMQGLHFTHRKQYFKVPSKQNVKVNLLGLNKFHFFLTKYYFPHPFFKLFSEDHGRSHTRIAVP